MKIHKVSFYTWVSWTIVAYIHKFLCRQSRMLFADKKQWDRLKINLWHPTASYDLFFLGLVLMGTICCYGIKLCFSHWYLFDWWMICWQWTSSTGSRGALALQNIMNSFGIMVAELCYYQDILVSIISIIYVIWCKGHLETYDVIIVIFSHVWTFEVMSNM